MTRHYKGMTDQYGRIPKSARARRVLFDLLEASYPATDTMQALMFKGTNDQPLVIAERGKSTWRVGGIEASAPPASILADLPGSMKIYPFTLRVLWTEQHATLGRVLTYECGPAQYGNLVTAEGQCPDCWATASRIELMRADPAREPAARCGDCGLCWDADGAWDPDTGKRWALTADGWLGAEMKTETETTEEEPTMARRRNTPLPDDTNGASVRPPKPRTSTRKLDVVLTAEERDERQESLLTALRDGEDLVAEKSAAMADFRQRGKALATRVVELRHAVTARIEKRDVKCEERFIDRTGEVQVVRLDTSAVIDTRAMTPEERQTWIPGTGPETSEVREPGQKMVKVTRRKKRGQAALPSVEG